MSNSTVPFPNGLAGRSLVLQPPGSPTDVPRFLTREMCAAILQQVHAFGGPGIDLDSWWRGDVRWARNRITTAGDWRTNRVTMGADSGGTDEVTLNQIDASSLRAAADRWDEYRSDLVAPPPGEPAAASIGTGPSYPPTHIWSDESYNQTPEERTKCVAQAIATAEQVGVLSAGYLAIEARGAFRSSDGTVRYAAQTVAQCSITVRDPETRASGWAGVSSFDWARIDVTKLAAIALDKCLKSRNPVKLEPGRYTTILEPQAVYGLITQLFSADFGMMDMSINENPDRNRKPFVDQPKTVAAYPVGQYDLPKQYGKTRIGQQVIDSRLTLRSDPMDPDLGTLPFSDVALDEWEHDIGDPFVPVTWIEHGVLKTLAMPGKYAMASRHQRAQPWPFTPVNPLSSLSGMGGAYRLESSEPPVALDDMIATTKRGLLVTRFWDVRIIDDFSVLCSGFTRDGLWLIKDGKVSHPVLNFRFTESPLFVLNNVEQIGAPVPIFSPECPALIPPLKVRDFSFTTLTDAV